ncbi:hypothetical protein [Sorangium sp. So ce854]|uniref:hypothetical protein n=1 Tax=Sorangium sp. So ce854 TaxID=3133322 RepID=UPI003F63B478
MPIRFFAFHRQEAHGPVLVDAGDTLAELPSNPILDELLRHYDFERKLFDEAPEDGSASALGEAIKRELTWLNPRVLVTCRSLVQTDPVHGLVVTSPS